MKTGSRATYPFPHLGRGMARVDGSSASGGGRQWWLGWRCLEARGSREVRLCGVGCYGKPCRALYRRGKAVQGEENILPATGGGGAAARSIREESRRGRRGSVLGFAVWGCGI
jgi:hypothetical protein